MKNQPVHFASALRHPEMIPASSPERPFAPRTLFVSTFPPEACGIATFTQDSVDAVDLASGGAPASVFAIERGQRQRYDDRRVAHVVRNDEQGSYRRAALAADAGPYDVVSLQHEFGLYPGDWGRDVLELVTQCRKPIITTLHTLISSPPKAARDVIRALVERSKGIVVMTNAAAALLSKGYGPFTTPVRVIPHGVPIVHRQYDAACKARLGLTGRRVLVTFGLISRGKGLEAMIDAMPAVLRRCPEAMYLIVGATHPKVKEHDGESYREGLIAKVEALGLSDAVRFVNRFVELPELMTYLGACDVYITPYPGEDQIASGTLAYAMAAGRPIVSTPYVYAREMLADGRGLLVPFGDIAAMAEATLRYLEDGPLERRTRRAAYAYAIPMRWKVVGATYLRFFDEILADRAAAKPARRTGPDTLDASRIRRRGGP